MTQHHSNPTPTDRLFTEAVFISRKTMRHDYTYISEDEKRRIQTLRTSGYSYREIAKIVGRHFASCQRIAPTGNKTYKPKLTEAQRAEIVRIYFSHPVTQRQLARQFGVTQSAISLVIVAAYKARKERTA